jgi:hypothetical protein
MWKTQFPDGRDGLLVRRATGMCVTAPWIRVSARPIEKEGCYYFSQIGTVIPQEWLIIHGDSRRSIID